MLYPLSYEGSGGRMRDRSAAPHPTGRLADSAAGRVVGCR